MLANLLLIQNLYKLFFLFSYWLEFCKKKYLNHNDQKSWYFVSFWGQKYADPFSLFLAPETGEKKITIPAPEIVIFCQLLGPETVVMVQFQTKLIKN